MRSASKRGSARKALSATEWKIMNICWRLGKATARQVYEESLVQQKRDYQTVKTLLDRIAAKGYLTTEKLGPLVLFTPKVARKPAVSRAIGDFVDTVLGRSLAPLYLHLAEQKDLEIEERAALEKLIERYERAEQVHDAERKHNQGEEAS